MRQELNVGEIVTVKRFGFTNTAGGSGDSNWKWNERFSGTTRVKVVTRWDDWETGERAIAEAADPRLVEYLERNANANDKRVFIGEFDLA